MVIEGGDTKLLTKLVDKQFEMIGEKVRIEDIPQDGIITINKKKMNWFDHYKWDSMEQYQEWRKWAYEQLAILGEHSADRVMAYVDLRYGLLVRYKKKGSFFELPDF